MEAEGSETTGTWRVHFVLCIFFLDTKILSNDFKGGVIFKFGKNMAESCLSSLPQHQIFPCKALKKKIGTSEKYE